jgi:serine/threonine protein kinase
MGIVYLGKDPKINRMLAIKTIDLAAEFEMEDLDEVRDRFLLEAETAGRLSHPNIVTIFDAGEEKNIAYIAMELLQGRHLSDYTRPERLLPVATTLELLARAAKAVDYAHRHNIVHRDIKPANIMYDSNTDELKLTDFGIARMMDVSRTRTGIVLGTPSYMSPEQLEGENVNGNTDLFSLGVSLYQLLTGHLPFRGTSMTELMFAIANEPHRPVTAIRQDLPSSLNVILDRALSKRPADRFESGIEMANAFRDAAKQSI